MISIIAFLPLLAALVSPVQAQTRYCYDSFGRVRRCSGLSYGARVGIGIAVAAGVLLIFGLCGFWRRRQIRNQFSKYQPPTLPFHSNGNNNNSTNPYANNPPPPNGSQTNWSNNPYGNNPPPPAQTYQPSSAGQYGGQNGSRNGDKVNGNGATATEGEHEHSYEWQQAREAERLERENGAAPPGYDVAASQDNTGNPNGYAPPPGAPPASKETPIVRNL